MNSVWVGGGTKFGEKLTLLRWSSQFYQRLGRASLYGVRGHNKATTIHSGLANWINRQKWRCNVRLSVPVPTTVHAFTGLLWLLTGGALFEVTGNLSRPKDWAAEATNCNSICNLCRILMRTEATHRGKNSWGVSTLAPLGSADTVLLHMSLAGRSMEGQPRSVGGDCQMILKKRRPRTKKPNQEK